MDLKLLGYSISTISVILLGAVAWPSPGEPAWVRWALIAGMATSIIGMGVRYLSHRQSQKKIERARQEARS